MNKIIITIFMIAAIQSCSSQSKKEESICIYFIDYEIMTPFKITSEYFNNVFIKEADSILINDKDTKKLLMQKIDELEFSENALIPDIRQKIIVRNNKEIKPSILYSDGVSAMKKNGKPVLFDQHLQMLINEIIAGKNKRE